MALRRHNELFPSLGTMLHLSLHLPLLIFVFLLFRPSGSDNAYGSRPAFGGCWSEERGLDLSGDGGGSDFDRSPRPLQRLESRVLRLLVRSQFQGSLPSRMVQEKRTPSSAARSRAATLIWNRHLLIYLSCEEKIILSIHWWISLLSAEICISSSFPFLVFFWPYSLPLLLFTRAAAAFTFIPLFDAFRPTCRKSIA